VTRISAQQNYGAADAVFVRNECTRHLFMLT
jgi:hypothetical protein